LEFLKPNERPLRIPSTLLPGLSGDTLAQPQPAAA
jgi:hypothetical protein